jgi:hypothetical protein
MSRRRAAVAALALAAAASFAGTGRAQDADGPGAGLTCGSAALGTAADAGQTAVTTAMAGGPWRAPDGAVVVLRCTLWLVTAPDAAPELVSIAQSAPGSLVTVPPVITNFVRQWDPGISFRQCTEVEVYASGRPPYPWQYDADPTTPGGQCRESAPSDGAVLTLSLTPPDPYGGSYCVWTEDPVPVVRETCIPWGWPPV